MTKYVTILFLIIVALSPMSRTFHHYAFLYQSKKKEQEIYTDNPCGSFDLQRLIAGKPAWRQASYVNEVMKRKLIIHDWTFFNYTEIQQEDFYILVEDLLNDGFEIYFWSGDAVKEITPENWYQYRWDPSKYLLKGSLKYTSSTNIKKWATDKLLCAEDDLFILDDYWLPVLRDHLNELPPRQLLISNLAKYSNPEEILSNSLGLTPKIEQVVLDEISSLAAHFYSSMKKFIESLDLKIIIHYKNLNLSDPEIGDLLQNEALNLFDLVIKNTDLHDIESVCFDD